MMQQGQTQQNTQPQNRQRYQYNFTSTQMRHYFYKPALRYLVSLISGVFLFIIGTQFGLFGAPFITLGVILFLVGGIYLLVYYFSIPTDDEYAKWVSERSQPLYKKALQRLHLDESQCESIIEIQGGLSSLLQLTKKFPEKEITVKRLSDGLRHYSINVCTYIFLTKDDLAIYSGYINSFAQNERFEDADHYYYKDIVGVSTSGPIYTTTIYISTTEVSEREFQRQGFLVRISNGEVAGTDYATKVELREGEKRVLIKGVDLVVAQLLALLRDHKEANKISGDVL